MSLLGNVLNYNLLSNCIIHMMVSSACETNQNQMRNKYQKLEFYGNNKHLISHKSKNFGQIMLLFLSMYVYV